MPDDPSGVPHSRPVSTEEPYAATEASPEAAPETRAGAPPATSAPGERRRRAGALAGRVLPGRRATLVVVLSAAAALLLVTTVAFAVLWSGARTDQSDADDIRRVAGAFADRFLTLDSENLDATKIAVLELSTGAFRRTYEEGLEAGVLEAILDLGRTRTDTTVDEVFLGDVDDRAAHVIVSAETVSRTVDEAGGAQPPRRVSFWLELDLVKQDGGWLIDGVRNLNFGARGSPAGPES